MEKAGRAWRVVLVVLLVVLSACEGEGGLAIRSQYQKCLDRGSTRDWCSSAYGGQ